MPIFTSNYPFYQPGHIALLSTPERTGALPQYTGRGVVIAFIDSAFYPHPDLGRRVILHVDATTNRIIETERVTNQNDLSWHGLMTSVIATGSGKMSGGKYRGIANEAELVLIKVSNLQGQIKEPDILRGLRWLADNHRRFNIRVVNISVGGDFESHDPTHPLYTTVSRLVAEGVIVVAAAGNRGNSFVVPPASAPDAITVGGIDDHNSPDKSLWTLYHHSYGPAYDHTLKPDLLAPAVWIASPILPESPVAYEAQWLAPLLNVHDIESARETLRRVGVSLGLRMLHLDDNVYATLQQRIHAHKLVDAHHQYVDGTSVAAPIVSSVVAQMLEANPNLTPQQIRAMLTDTANPLPDVSQEIQGAGILNAARAVEAAENSSSP